MGENFYNKRDFALAAEAYQALLDRFPSGKFGDSALYAKAWCEFEQEDMEGGVATMGNLVSDFPPE